MKNISIFLGLCAVMVLSAAFPLVEDEDGNWVELIPVSRVPRRAPWRKEYAEARRPVPVIRAVPVSAEERYEPMASASFKEPVAAETGYGHSHHPYDYVDYGAYTGGWGAFGWYTDHPVHTGGHSGY